MRTAQVRAAWDGIRRDPERPFAVRGLSFDQFPGFEVGQLAFNGPLNVVCGLNGSGKTTLVRILWYLLDPTRAELAPGTKQRIDRVRARLELRWRGRDYTREMNFGANLVPEPLPEEASVIHLEPAEHAIALKNFFAETVSIGDTINGIEAYDLDAASPRLINYVLKKEYTKVEIFEIERESNNIPYIRVVEYDYSYDIATMSLGEISVIYMFWRIHLSNTGSVILIEEPETFISPVSQSALMNMFAKNCNERTLFFVISTHSASMLARLEDSDINFVYRTMGQARVSTREMHKTMRKSVGMVQPRRNIIVVEDRLAREFVRLLIRQFDIQFLNETEIANVSGAGAVSDLLRLFPTHLEEIRIVGVYDGDVRNQLLEANGRPRAFLPDQTPLEQMFRTCISDRIGEAAELLSMPSEELRIILARLDGLDHHDWYEEAARELGLDYNQLLVKLFDLWIRYNRLEAEAAFGEIMRGLGRD
jgi:predicted ATPase